MGITYPQGLGITISAYPLPQKYVQKLSTYVVDNLQVLNI